MMLLLACDTPVGGCDLDGTAADLAGDGAIVCGADDGACAVAAFEAGDAFTFRSDTQGIDSIVSRVMVSDGARLWRLSQDDEDGPNGRIDGVDCLDVVADAENGLLECGRTEPENNHYEVCGTCSGCNPPGLPFEP